jgi:hypothetical protein
MKHLSRNEAICFTDPSWLVCAEKYCFERNSLAYRGLTSVVNSFDNEKEYVLNTPPPL